MVEKTFSVTLPDYILPGFGWQESEAPYRIREALVMELLRLPNRLNWIGGTY